MFVATALILAIQSISGFSPTDAQIKARYSDQYRTCMKQGDAAQGITSGMMDCMGLEIDRQDDKLNQAYRATLKRLSKRRQGKLRESERAWVKRSDRDCVAAGNASGGGSAAGPIFNDCTITKLITRRMWLEVYR